MGEIDYRKINQNKRYCNEQVYYEVAENLEVPEQLVKDIFNAQSEFTAKIIKRGAFESVTFVYLGKIKAKLRAVSKILSNPKKAK